MPDASFWLPHTRLYPPQPGADLHPRPELLARLSLAVRSHRLTLLSAPAGSGKTTLLACLLQTNPEFPSAWITLDEDDNDPASFLRLLLASLQRLFPALGEDLRVVFEAAPPTDAHLRRAMAALINALHALDPAPFGLVLDDLHLIDDQAVLQAVDYLLEHLPPCMHLLATARHDPPLALPRLRARGYLAEFHLEQLRFNRAELSAWLNDELQLALDERALRLFYDQTDGWIAGLRLLALSLDQAPGPEARRALFARLEHGQRHIFDFLMQEVFLQQPPDLQQFLLETSFLLELTPSLCRAVTGRPAAGELLEAIYRRNLFLALSEALPLGEDHSGDREGRTGLRLVEPTYRYHALFAEFLQQELRRRLPERMPELYHRAVEAHPDPARRIHYALEAGLWEPAILLVEAMGRQRLTGGQLGQLVRWIRQIPEGERSSHPWLNLVLSAEAIQRGCYDSALPHLEGILPRMESSQDEDGQTEALAQMGEIYTCLAQTGKAQGALEKLLLRPLSSDRRVKARLNQLWTAYYRRDWGMVEAQFPPLLFEVQRSSQPGDWLNLALSLGPQLAFIPDGVRLLESFCLQALNRFGQQAGPLQAAARAYLGYLYFLQARLEEARRSATEARRLCDELGGFAHLDIFIDHVLLFDLLHRSDLDAFTAYLEQCLERVSGVLTRRQFLAAYLYLSALGAAHQARPELVTAAQRRLQNEHIAYEVPDVAAARHMLEALVAGQNGQMERAEAALCQALEIQESFRHSLLMANARSELSRLYWERGKKALAVETLSPLLLRAAPGGMPGLLLQSGPGLIPLLEAALASSPAPGFVEAALALFGRQASASAKLPVPKRLCLENGEHLSDRELEVLRLVAAGLSNQEIAGQLYISPGTAKRHTINIYRKLQVNSRTQAIARAREWKLL